MILPTLTCYRVHVHVQHNWLEPRVVIRVSLLYRGHVKERRGPFRRVQGSDAGILLHVAFSLYSMFPHALKLPVVWGADQQPTALYQPNKAFAFDAQRPNVY